LLRHWLKHNGDAAASTPSTGVKPKALVERSPLLRHWFKHNGDAVPTGWRFVDVRTPLRLSARSSP